MLLTEWAASAEVRVRVVVANNISAPVSALAMLARDPLVEVRAAVATHPALDNALIELLITDNAATVRRRVSKTHELPFSVLSRLLLSNQLSASLHTQLVAKLDDETTAEELADLDQPVARYTVVRFGRLTSKTAHTIVAEHTWLAPWLVLNERAPLAVLKTLVEPNRKHSIVVRRGAALQIAQRSSAAFWRVLREPPVVVAARLNQPECARRVRIAAHLRRRSPAIARALAARPDLSRWSRQALSGHNRWDVRAVLAGRQDISAGDFRRLKKTTDWAVLGALSANRALTAIQLAQIREPHPAIALAKVRHTNCPTTILLNAISVWNPDPYLRAVALRHPAVDVATLQAAAEDLRAPAWVLSSIARNPSCPSDVRDGLLAWIAVGGSGSSDPMFDPVTGVGHPGDTRTDRSVALTALADVRSPVAIFRLAWARARSTLGLSALQMLARDPDPAVRQRAAQFTNRLALKALAEDADASVAQQALSLLPTVPKESWRARGTAMRSLSPLLGRLAVVIVIAAGANGIGSISNPSTPDPLPRSGMDAPFPTAPVPAISFETQRNVTVQTSDTQVICTTPAIEIQLVAAGNTMMMVRVRTTTDVLVGVLDAIVVVGPTTATPNEPVVAGVQVISGHAHLKVSTPTALSTVSFDVDPSALTLKGTCL